MGRKIQQQRYLSGEAQRMKLASESAQESEIGTLLYPDEPTTGFALPDDTYRLLKVLGRLR